MTDSTPNSLFGQWDDYKAPAQRHSETSQAAASAIEPSAATLRGQVLALLQRSQGMTDEEIQDSLGMNPSTQRPRRVELVDDGRVVDSGKKRKTKSGRAATIWRVK